MQRRRPTLDVSLELFLSRAKLEVKRTRALCVNVNNGGWSQAGWIFFPPFQETSGHDHSDSEHLDSDHLAGSSDNAAVFVTAVVDGGVALPAGGRDSTAEDSIKGRAQYFWY
jgi:hypothetical protein